MAAGASAAQPTEPVGEARWPAAGAVLAAIVLTVLLPQGERVGPGWLLPAIEVVLLAAIVAGDPGRINRRSRLLRGLSIALVTVLVLGALSSTVLLIDALVHAVTRDGPGSFSPCRPADTAHRRTTRGGGGGGDG
jgi:hypothetical protein